MHNNLQQQFGNIDIYLFDGLLKGDYDSCHKVADLGCGGGRNIVYFLKNGFDVYGCDQDAMAVAAVKELAAELAPKISPDNFTVAALDKLPYPNDSFDLVLCSAVLHFAANEAHFAEMLAEAWRVLKPGGYFFARLASSIGIEHLVTPLDGNRYLLPDGSIRFLVTAKMLEEYTQKLNALMHEPIKTTNVDNKRCMTTWRLQKR
jgi:SAM-dependent methyltransferase